MATIIWSAIMAGATTGPPITKKWSLPNKLRKPWRPKITSTFLEISQIKNKSVEIFVKGITKKDLVKLRILVLLSDTKDKLSVTAISEKLGVKYETTHHSIAFLNACGLLKLSEEIHGSLAYEYAELSPLGKKVSEVIDLGILDKQ